MCKLRSPLAIFTILFLFQLNTYSQFKKLSGIHDVTNSSIEEMLQKSGYGKIHLYYDDKRQIEGGWDLYPSLQISNNIIAVHVSEIPGLTSKYNFLLLIDIKSLSVIDTLGPYYDSFVDAIDVRLKKNQIQYLKVRLTNPPEMEEPRYTIIEYSNEKTKLIKVKSYDRD